MRTTLQVIAVLLLLTASLCAQGKHLWALRDPGELVEYDVTTFAVKQRVKLPPEALKAPGNISVNSQGQILFAPAVPLPLSDSDISAPHQVWIWNGHTAASLDQSVVHKVEDRGSNRVITESVPMPYLAADGSHLFWFANEVRRLVRESADLSTTITWQAWRTDLTGSAREEMASLKLPECTCATGVCEETCPSAAVWSAPEGVDKFFLMTQFVAGQTETNYKSSVRYQEENGKWKASPLAEALMLVLDASSSGSVIVESIPDAACCGWSNQSNDQTLVLTDGMKKVVFDEQATYRNPDYDVSFYTPNAQLSPDMKSVAMTVVSTAQANKPIQLSEEGEANPQESQGIRKALAELPAVAVKSMEDVPRQIAFVPHATLVGWISEKELLIVEGHVLVVYNLGSGSRRRSSVKVEDVGRVFLR